MGLRIVKLAHSMWHLPRAETHWRGFDICLGMYAVVVTTPWLSNLRWWFKNRIKGTCK